MDELFTSDQFRLKPRQSPYFREEIFVSETDARSAGLSDAGQSCIFAIEPTFPGPEAQEFAVYVSVEAGQESGAVLVNQHFLENAGIRPDDERFWSVKRAPTVAPVGEAVIEMVVERENVGREIDSLRRERRELFLNRCLLFEPGQSVTDLSLPVLGRGYFNFRSLQPEPETFRSKTILVFDEDTTLNLFVPHRKGGVDMVIIVDASNSMDLCDYVGADGKPHLRIEGVKVALETLLQRRLVSGSRVSCIAAVVFGANTQMLYPLQETEMVELKDESQIEEMRSSTRHLSGIGLERLGVEREQTNISAALQYAAELLDYYSQAGNEKMLVLLSDGADWTEDTGSVSKDEIVSTTEDPAVLADSLHFDSQVRIHTVAISDKQALRRHEDRRYWDMDWAIPNTNLLRKIADFTEGLFFESPDARVLTKLFDELGEGALYSL